MTYHNTTGASGSELKEYTAKANRQADAVLAYYRDRPWRGFSPSQVRLGLKTEAPLTSIRRAITDLAKEGVLVKTTEQAEGPYGRREHKWRWAGPTEPVQERLL